MTKLCLQPNQGEKIPYKRKMVSVFFYCPIKQKLGKVDRLKTLPVKSRNYWFIKN